MWDGAHSGMGVRCQTYKNRVRPCLWQFMQRDSVSFTMVSSPERAVNRPCFLVTPSVSGAGSIEKRVE